MEYRETSEGQIQADFARRVGQILISYEQDAEKSCPEDRYEATLTICLLQTLLTYCKELINRKSKKDSTGLIQIAKTSVIDEPTRLGFRPDCIVHKWESNRALTYREIVEGLRNALSHPLPQVESKFIRTGYTTSRSGSGQIEAFTFVHSPWVSDGGGNLRTRYWLDEKRLKPKEDLDKKLQALHGEINNWSSNYGTQDLRVKQVDRKHQIFLRDKPFIPYLQIELSTKQLRTLTVILSERLANPLEELNALMERAPAR